MERNECAHHAQDEIHSFRRGDTIFRQGDPGRCMYVVLRGQIDFQIDGRVVDAVNSGGILGEMALVDGSPRIGTAIAVTDGAVLRVDEAHFQEFVAQKPAFALKVLRTVVKRVRRTCPPLSSNGTHHGHRHH